jgi:hypothetical protein
VSTISCVFSALLFCSDGDCAEVFEAFGSLEELEALACDCGCSLELLELSNFEDAEVAPGFELTPLR